MTERDKRDVNNFIFVFRSEHDILYSSPPRKMQIKMKLEPSETSLREKAKGKAHGISVLFMLGAGGCCFLGNFEVFD